MTTETQKTIESMNEALNAHNVEKFAEHFAEDGTFQDPLSPTAMKGKNELKKHLTGLFTAFPDFHVKMGNILVHGGNAVVLNTATGTNTGPIWTPAGKQVAATNKKLVHEAATYFETNDKGKVTKARVYGDSLTILQQLGLPPQ